MMCDTKILVTFHHLLAQDVIGVAKTGSGKTLGYLLPGREKFAEIWDIYVDVRAASTILNNSLIRKNTIIQL